MALQTSIFLVNGKVVPGGASCLSRALYYLTGGAVPIGFMIPEQNIIMMK